MSGLDHYIGVVRSAFIKAEKINQPSTDIGRGEPNNIAVDLDGKTELMQAVSDG